MAAPARGATFVYVGNTESNEIYVLQLDRPSGSLTVVEKVPIPGVPRHAHEAEGIPDGEEPELGRDRRPAVGRLPCRGGS
jgi:hypothetical protein